MITPPAVMASLCDTCWPWPWPQLPQVSRRSVPGQQLRGHFPVQVITVTLLTLHAGLDLTELALPGQKLLSLFIDLPLHLDLNLPQLLFLASKLLFLETHGL